jgi:hypothetical protein
MVARVRKTRKTTPQKRGRGRPRTDSKIIFVRVHPSMYRALIKWHDAQGDDPGLPETVRRMLTAMINEDYVPKARSRSRA